MPEVSVIIPAYNSAHFLPDAVESVLAQTYHDYEVLVIDDGSIDETEAVMRRYGPRVRYIRQPNGGVASARNHGIAESTGRYIAFLDADDTWMPSKLERQLAILKNHPQYRACFSAFLVVKESLTPIRIKRYKGTSVSLTDLLMRGNIVGSPSTVLCDRSLFEVAGDFDPEFSQCADWNMWIRLAMHTEFYYVDEPLTNYRQHNCNMSRNVQLLEHDSVGVLEKGFSMQGITDGRLARREKAFARNFMVLAGCYFHAKHFKDFVRCAYRSLSLDLSQVGYLMGFPGRILARLWTCPRTAS